MPPKSVPENVDLVGAMANYALGLLQHLNGNGTGGYLSDEDIYGPHNEPIPGSRAGAGQRWTAPSGDYFQGQAGGTLGSNPLAAPIRPDAGIGYEQLGYGPAPAPYGYTESGRPRQFAGQTDADLVAKGHVGISEYAPGRVHGPTINEGRQTAANPGTESGGNAASRRVKAT